jgi:hypothetical protein
MADSPPLRLHRGIGSGSVLPPIPDLTAYDVVLEPERDECDWWAGAPSVAMAPDGTVWLACRMREAKSPRGERGYAIWILRSSDAYHFEHVHTIHRDDLRTVSVERPALVLDPLTGRFKLYICRAGKPQPGGWRVDKLEDVDDPAKFDPATARPVVTAPPFSGAERGVKDPFVINVSGVYWMYVIAYGFIRGSRELPYVYSSIDGEKWVYRGGPVLRSAGWHDFFTRPAFVMPLGGIYAFYYEGSSSGWFDPPYNIQGGVAVTTDLRTATDLTPDAPLFASPTPGRYQTARYTDYLCLEDRVIFYYEAARPNDSFELRATTVML